MTHNNARIEKNNIVVIIRNRFLSHTSKNIGVRANKTILLLLFAIVFKISLGEECFTIIITAFLWSF